MCVRECRETDRNRATERQKQRALSVPFLSVSISTVFICESSLKSQCRHSGKVVQPPNIVLFYTHTLPLSLLPLSPLSLSPYLNLLLSQPFHVSLTLSLSRVLCISPVSLSLPSSHFFPFQSIPFPLPCLLFSNLEHLDPFLPQKSAIEKGTDSWPAHGDNKAPV